MAKKQAFNLEEYKKNLKLADTPLKEDKFIELDECLHAVLGMPGIPCTGHITQVYGKSDTGKTSLMFHAAAQAQKQGLLPVCIITEGKVDWERAKTMGFNRDGAIVNESCSFLEDAFDFIDKICADVEMGELPHDVMIFWDSIGNTLSREEVEVKEDGTWEKKSTMMKAAKVLSERLRVASKKINDSRKVTYPKSVGLMMLNTAYTQPPQWPGGPSVLTPYGGTAPYYKSSLIIKTARKKKLKATKDGVEMGFGIVAEITVDKNHLTNTAHSGEFIITADQIIPNEKEAINHYKDTHKEQWGSEIELKESKE